LDADGVSDVQMVHGHQGGQHDFESHLVHFRHRDLNVVLGRWTRQDPLGYVDGGSLYEYVRGGPVNLRDSLGLQASPVAHVAATIARVAQACGRLEAARATRNPAAIRQACREVARTARDLRDLLAAIQSLPGTNALNQANSEIADAEGAADGYEEAEELGWQLASGHAGTKHAEELLQGNVPDDPAEATGAVADVISNAVKNVKDGYSAFPATANGASTVYADTKSGVVVIKDPSTPDGGTAYRPGYKGDGRTVSSEYQGMFGKR
jgi:RHS repeat-associated protein